MKHEFRVKKITYSVLNLLVLVIFYLRLPQFAGGDTAQWAEVANQMNKGLALYTDVYDNKDPAFFMVLQVFDSMFAELSVLLLYLILWTLIGFFLWWIIGFQISNFLLRTFLASSFTLFLNFTSFGSADSLTNLLPAVIVLGAFSFLYSNRYIFASLVTLSIVPFIKLQFLLVCIPIFVHFAFQNRKRIEKGYFVILTTFAVIVGALFREVSLNQWLEATRENVQYANNSPKMIFNVRSHVQILIHHYLTDPQVLVAIACWVSSVMWLIYVNFCMERFHYKKLVPLRLILTLNVVSAVSFISTFVWSHHVTILLLPLLLNIFAFMSLIKKSSMSARFVLGVSPHCLSLAVLFLVCLSNILPTNLRYNLDGEPNLKKRIFYLEKIPFSWELQLSDSNSYSYLGRGYLSTFPGRFIQPNIRLSCPDTFIFGFFENRAKRQLDCSKGSDVIFVSNTALLPNDTVSKSLESEFGVMHSILKREFVKVLPDWYDWSMYIKRTK